MTSVVPELRGFAQEMKSARETFKTKWAESLGIEGVSGDSPPRKLRKLNQQNAEKVDFECRQKEWSSLPPEILDKIFFYLPDVRDKMAVGHVCTSFRESVERTYRCYVSLSFLGKKINSRKYRYNYPELEGCEPGQTRNGHKLTGDRESGNEAEM